jgi:hypothetical protein
MRALQKLPIVSKDFHLNCQSFGFMEQFTAGAIEKK